LAACATPARPPASATAPEAYRIGAGDEFRVRVHPEPGFSRRLKVRSDGAISVDMIGDVRAADRRPDEVDAIRGGYAESDMLLQSGDVVVVPAVVPVVAGYKVRRALFPVEQLFRTLLGGPVGALVP
jgi:protein involved in polysaccharide export with SLBB domain